MKSEAIRRKLAIVVLVAGIVMLLIGATRKHKVYDNSADLFGIQPFHRVSESALIIDTTFGGVERKDGKLYSTYNRLEARAKRACPT
jgi:hypothetical protein